MTKEWYQKCKDCGIEFGYSDYALQRDLKKGFSRPERCKDCRDIHDKEIKSIASSHFGLIPRKQKRSILGLPYLGHIEHGTRILRDEPKEPDPSGMDIGMTPEHMVRIYKALDDYQVLVIVAPTGTGKSTYIPFHLIDPLEGYEKDKFTKHGPIVVTQPRIPAASGIPKAIGEKLLGSNVGPGFEIGYRHSDRSGEKKGEVFDRRNRLLFVTDGSLLNWITDGKIGDYSMIIVDEAHERSSNIDLILGLIKQELLKYPHLKLIIASATIDTNSFVNYFGEVADTKLLDFADCQKSYGYEELPWKAKEEDMIERLVDNSDALEVKNKLKSHQEKIINGVVDKVLNILDETYEGGILGFLQGQPEIDAAVELIKDRVKSKKEIKVFPLYTKLGKKRIDEAIKEFEESDKSRRVVIATNIAETSLTIPDIVYVVDSGLIKQSEWNPTTCREELKTRFHSKDGCKQRWGRAGRVQKGYAYKLYNKKEFIKYFPLHTSPEITRECLDDVVLRAKASGVQDVDPSEFSWIEKPPEDELNRALNVFNERGLVDQDNDMTEEGREVYRLSNRISRFLEDNDHNSTNRALDVATMLIFADKYACLIEAVTALVMMPHMGNSLYWDKGLLLWDKEWDIQSKDHITRLHNELRMGCIDDLDFACKLFALYEGKISGIPDAVLNSWSKRYKINEENFKLIKEAREEILDVFTQGKKTNVLRPIDFSLIKRVRLLMAIAWPDRIVSIKKGTPLRFVLNSKTKIEGIMSENTTGNWANQEEAIVAMMDQSKIVINGNKKGAPVANFIIQTPEEIPSKEAANIISKIQKLRNEYDPQKTFSSLFTHLHIPIGARVTVDSSSKQLNVSDAVLPSVFQPTFDESLSTNDETDSDSPDLYDYEKYPKSREWRRNKSFGYLPSTKKTIVIKPNFKIGWSNEITGNNAFVENWKDINGEQIVILNTIDQATDNRESLKNIRTDDKPELILKRPVFDMLQRKIIGFIAENEEGITFPISASNLSIEQNNP
jgi:HrpA-like RNA helicase